jgi:hypothetical protein
LRLSRKESGKAVLVVSPQESTERARIGAHALWAKLRQQMRDADPEATQEHLVAAERARRRLAVLRARRELAEAERAAADAGLAVELVEVAP